MSEITTITSSYCKIKQDPEFHLYNDLKFEFPLEQDVSTIDNLNHKKELDEFSSIIKEEIAHDGIKSEEIVEDDCVLFNTDISLRVEENTSFYCHQLCGLDAHSEDGLKSHTLTHKYIRAANRNRFKVHTKLKHSKENKLFRCDKCDYKTSIKSNLTTHTKIHSDEKPFKCSLCDFCSKHSYILKIHEMKHSGEKPFTCNKCNFNTYFKSSLRIHQRIHSKEKQFKCKLCDFSSKYADTYKLHMMKHSGEQPFKCDECDYILIRNSTWCLTKGFTRKKNPLDAVCVISVVNIRTPIKCT
ncbi:hypothetical protein FQR65_LT01577 [Abscondita terminalis]|nr:hypothetical protein FQR65_LT01577 [Abscondita terminalis]